MDKLPNDKLEEHNMQKIEESFEKLDLVLHKRHVDYLTNFNVMPIESSLKDAIKNMRVNRVCRIVYDRNEDNLEKLQNVYSAVSSYGSSCAVVVRSCRTHADVFIGTQSMAGERGRVPGNVFFQALKGNFQGIDLSPIKGESNLSSVLPETPKFLANVLGVPSLKNEEADSFTQGLEKIVDAILGKELCVLLLAEPVSRDLLDVAESGYHELYSALSIMEQQQITLSETESRALSESVTEAISETITNGTTTTTTTNSSRTKSAFDGKKAVTQAASGAVSGAVAAGMVSGGLGAPAGAVIGGLGGLALGLFGGSKTDGTSDGKSENTGKSKGKTFTKGKTDTQTISAGKSTQYTLKNRPVTEILHLIDEQLERIRECKNLGMWNWGAYFFGQDEVAVKTGANIYAGLLSGESTGVERSAVSFWRKGDKSENNGSSKFDALMAYLRQLRHPVFEMPEGFGVDKVLPTSLISTKEMAVAMSLPQKSLPGIPVFDSVEFGRSVTTFDDVASESGIDVGAVSHLGAVNSRQRVELNSNSFTSHVFVTGSTGSGKSNTIYSLLKKLYDDGEGIPFLVIEPAKGEYKNVFGGLDGVSVFGTNSALTPVLRLNPFSFPKEIHIAEHIDRLIEILNAVWPMYAAMPAVLKAGVEAAYEQMGWDLVSSSNQHGRYFPDFKDLRDVLPSIIEKSAYDDEVKGNYTGALVTRIESLTNGYYRSIFQKEELSESVLFDSPCIVDLSRVGSLETKSLLMGILFMKLQEYRMARAEGSNSELKHITIMEEAHNLMRRTSFDQSGEGANLQGKAVEMISNAIAEMRTYGEGFIIADQAPGLLDQSVIRNTNTKIILRLPDWEDRELVGKAANLKNEQIEELARLKTGCAAIYQNNWQEAVLCQFGRFNGGVLFEYAGCDVSASYPLERKREFLKFLLQHRSKEAAVELTHENLDRYGLQFFLPLKRLAERGGFDKTALDNEITALINIAEITKPKIKNYKRWIERLKVGAFENAGPLTEPLKRELVRSMFHHFATRTTNQTQREKWMKLEADYA